MNLMLIYIKKSFKIYHRGRKKNRKKNKRMSKIKMRLLKKYPNIISIFVKKITAKSISKNLFKKKQLVQVTVTRKSKASMMHRMGNKLDIRQIRENLLSKVIF